MRGHGGARFYIRAISLSRPHLFSDPFLGTQRRMANILCLSPGPKSASLKGTIWTVSGRSNFPALDDPTLAFNPWICNQDLTKKRPSQYRIAYLQLLVKGFPQGDAEVVETMEKVYDSELLSKVSKGLECSVQAYVGSAV
ncbi:hypothetical protein BJ170DRAFT_617928 [Xylariales sp. AK1849]|nr:hypothetical protein BJ170DRAFT_617928 [Xylariales sp. AK1849]